MAFIGISIPEKISDKLSKIKVPGEKEDKEEYHITLIHFEDKHTSKQMMKIIEIISGISSQFQAFEFKTSELSSFPKYENNPIPIILKIKSDVLFNLQAQIKKSLEKENIDFSKTFKEFKPHITLSYFDGNDFKGKDIVELKSEIKEITYFGGEYKNNYLKIDFKLGAKNSSLEKKAEMFEDWAKS